MKDISSALSCAFGGGRSNQEERHKMTLEALADVDAGCLINHRAIREWAESLTTDNPLPPPVS